MNATRYETTVTPTFTRRVSWGAIWAGMFVTIVMEIMFILLGISCGIATLNPAANQATETHGLSMAAAIWLMASWLVAVGVGARVAGWMSGGPRRADGLVHGMVVWAFSAAVILLVFTGVIGAGGPGAKNGIAGFANGGMFYSMSQPNESGNMNTTPNNAGGVGNANGTGTGTGANNGAGMGTTQDNAQQATWTTALWTFIALALGLAVASFGGAMGAGALERSRIVTTTAT